MLSSSISRRDLLGRLLGVAMTPILLGGSRWIPRGTVRHPEPRPGVTAEHVLAAADVDAKHRDAYAAAREIPEILDGIYCHCDCADRHSNLRSLLSCFETEMPMSCGVCSGEARTALRLHKKGKTLDEIRTAIDKQYS